jgi:hypothetical protein
MKNTRLTTKQPYQQRLLSFLLRNGYNYQDGTNWTQKHMN